MTVVRRNKAYGLAAEKPCSRYWISEERAKEIICRLENGEQITNIVKGHSGRWGKPSSSSLQIEQITSLYERFKQVCVEHPRSSFSTKVYIAVSSPAPKFFITPRTAKAFCCRYRKSMSVMERLNRHAKIRVKQDI